MYYSNFVRRGPASERKKNLENLLRLSLGAVEIASTRREVLDAVTPHQVTMLDNLMLPRHNVYETSVVFEFSQLAREDFARHGNLAVWERPLDWMPAAGTYRRHGSIDMALFSESRGFETRIEFGKSSPMRRTFRDTKLESDAEKLFESKSEPPKLKRADGTDWETENFIVLWAERDSRAIGSQGGSTRQAGQLPPRLTQAAGDKWLENCKRYAAGASKRLQIAVELETVAASSLVSLRRDHHRTAYAAIYSV